MKPSFVLFDFDGVIADTFELLTELSIKRCRHRNAESYRSAFEGNIYENDVEHDPILLPGDHSECTHDIDWWKEYESIIDAAPLFAGMDEIVRTLAASHRLVILTSSRARHINTFLAKHGMEGLFESILDMDVHTHKTKKIEMLFDEHGIGASDCVFVTDTLGDVREANHHSVGSIACTWGFHSRETLEKGVPFRIVEKPHEILDAVGDYFAARS